MRRASPSCLTYLTLVFPLLAPQGPDNWWQVAQTPYGDWLEATSTQKAAVYSKNWQVAVALGSPAYTNIPPLLGGRGGGALGGACVGAYAFSYGWCVLRGRRRARFLRPPAARAWIDWASSL